MIKKLLILECQPYIISEIYELCIADCKANESLNNPSDSHKVTLVRRGNIERILLFRVLNSTTMYLFKQF